MSLERRLSDLETKGASSASRMFVVYPDAGGDTWHPQHAPDLHYSQADLDALADTVILKVVRETQEGAKT